jgi:hypothetical protein
MSTGPQSGTGGHAIRSRSPLDNGGLTGMVGPFGRLAASLPMPHYRVGV